MKPKLCVMCSLLLTALSLCAADRTYRLVTSNAATNHWPGPDGLIVTGDDAVSGSLSPNFGSEPNSTACLSYNAFGFGSGHEVVLLPAGMSAVTFIRGSVTIDGTVGAQGGGPLIKGWEIYGTEPFPDHGPYTSSIVKVSAGTYNAVTKAFTGNIDFIANLVSGNAVSTNFAFSGTAYVIDSAAFGSPTGDTYVDSVLVPLAQSLGASSLFFAKSAGVVPASSSGTGGYFPSMPIQAVLVGIIDGQAPARPQIQQPTFESEGLRLRWSVEQGRTYAVEAGCTLTGSFTNLAEHLSGPEYLDSSAKQVTTRFYRIRVE